MRNYAHGYAIMRAGMTEARELSISLKVENLQ